MIGTRGDFIPCPRCRSFVDVDTDREVVCSCGYNVSLWLLSQVHEEPPPGSVPKTATQEVKFDWKLEF